MVQCDNLLDVKNGHRMPTEDSVTCGTKVWYSCDEGFLLEGDIVLECGAGGELLAKFLFAEALVIVYL